MNEAQRNHALPGDGGIVVWDDIPIEGHDGGDFEALERLCAITMQANIDRLDKEGKDSGAILEARSADLLTPEGWAKLIDDIPKTLEDGATWKDDKAFEPYWRADADALPAAITCNRLRVALAKAWLYRQLSFDLSVSHSLAEYLQPPKQEPDTAADNRPTDPGVELVHEAHLIIVEAQGRKKLTLDSRRVERMPWGAVLNQVELLAQVVEQDAIEFHLRGKFGLFTGTDHWSDGRLEFVYRGGEGWQA